MQSHLLKKITSFPEQAGVYQMLDASRKILYVGKANNLKKRIASYFRKNILDPKTKAMMQKVSDIAITITENEHQALLLESDLIKQYHPRYNILFRDDKSYPYLFLSEHAFPRLDYARRKKREKGLYFGPYPNLGAVRDTVAWIQKIFQLRTCRDVFFKNRTRPCLQYQLNRCTAPCVGYVSEKEYDAQVHDAILFLRGKNKVVVRAIKKRMQQVAQQQEFEKAARERDLLLRLQKLQDQPCLARESLHQYLDQKNLYLKKWEAFRTFLKLSQSLNRIECFDISHTSGVLTKGSCVAFDIQGPVKSHYRQFNIDGIQPGDDYAAMKQMLTRRYVKRERLPDVIIIDGGKGQLKQAEMVLTDLNIQNIILMSVAKGIGRKPGLEKLYFSGRKTAIQLKSDHLALHLIQLIRDEAHRFAIQAHRKKLRKKLLNKE